MNCFICPLSKKELTEPVVAADGYTYERAAIEAYFSTGRTTSPITGEELTDKTLVPNKTLKSLIQNKSTKKLEELQQKYLEMKAENIASSKPTMKPKEILEMLQKVEAILKKYKDGSIKAEACLKELEPFAVALPEDDELQQEYIILCYWTGKYSKAQPSIDILSKSPLFDMIGPLLSVYAKAQTNKTDALNTYNEIAKSKEANLFRVRDIKYKAIALNSLGMNKEALTHFDAYEVFVPYDPSVYVLFRGKTLKDMGMLKELKNYQTDYFIKYGTFTDLANIQ